MAKVLACISPSSMRASAASARITAGVSITPSAGGTPIDSVRLARKRAGARSLPATAEYLFSTAEDLWETVFRQIGRRLLQSMLNVKELPPDPTVN